MRHRHEGLRQDRTASLAGRAEGGAVFPRGLFRRALLSPSGARAAGAALLLLVGCDSAETRPAPTSDAPRAEAPSGAPAAAPSGMFSGGARWLGYEEGLKEARATGKPLCVVVYAEWCARCRELDQMMRTPRFEELGKRFVMVRQDADAGDAWLKAPPFSQLGGYVPRVFFLSKDGSFNAELKSPHPRFPYFYSAQQPEALEKSMRAALGE
ncbi:MAG: thioredoxin family protein [Polyangiaceae bacterium]|nr:thioredoxin family protein [Polyangiaceae bacterium]